MDEIVLTAPDGADFTHFALSHGVPQVEDRGVSADRVRDPQRTADDLSACRTTAG